MIDTNSEKLKVRQKFFNSVWRMNRINKLCWIKLGCFGCDMWIAFTHLLRRAAVCGSLPGSYLNDPSIIISLKLSFGVQYFDIHV